MRPDAGRRVPVVDGRVVLDAGIGARPGGVGDLVPQVARLDGADDPAVGAPAQLPVFVVLDGLDEVVGDAHRVVRVLARDGGVGFAVEVAGVAGGDQRGDLLLLFGLPD